MEAGNSKEEKPKGEPCQSESESEDSDTDSGSTDEVSPEESLKQDMAIFRSESGKFGGMSSVDGDSRKSMADTKSGTAEAEGAMMDELTKMGRTVKVTEFKIKPVKGAVASSSKQAGYSAKEEINGEKSIHFHKLVDPVGNVHGLTPGEDLPPNPLTLLTVVNHLFQFIGVKALQDLRLVCTEWDKAACCQLRKRAALFYDGTKFAKKKNRKLSSLLNIMHQNSGSRFQTYQLLDANLVQFRVLKLESQFHVKSLMLGPTLPSVSDMEYILSNFTNLESLSLFSHNMDASIVDWINVQNTRFKLKSLSLCAAHTIHPDVVVKFFNTCPELKSFTAFFLHINVDFVRELFMLASMGQISLSNLETLSLGKKMKTIATTYSVLCLGSYPWNLTCLSITLSAEMDPMAFTHLLDCVKNTLKTLVCSMDPVTPGFQIVLPPTMVKLETFAVITDNSMMCMGPLVSSIKLPRLTNLKLSRRPHEHELCIPKMLDFAEIGGVHLNFDSCWNSFGLLDSFGCNFHLRVLQLPFGFNRREMFYDVTTSFPYLRDLRLQNPSSEVIRAVFERTTLLEKLSIRMLMFPDNIDSILTGLKGKWCETMVNKKKFKFVNPSTVEHHKPGLKDMKNLKYLELRQCPMLAPIRMWPSCCPMPMPLSEVTLYHGLMYLSRAVQIDLQGVNLSASSIEELQATLGPTCYINIMEEPSNFGDFWANYTDYGDPFYH